MLILSKYGNEKKKNIETMFPLSFAVFSTKKEL